MEDFVCYIAEMQDLVFSYNFKKVDETFLDKIYLWENIVPEVPQDKLEEFNQIMLNVFSARQKHDYLLQADLFEYEVKPFLEMIAKDN